MILENNFAINTLFEGTFKMPEEIDEDSPAEHVWAELEERVIKKKKTVEKWIEKSKVLVQND